MADYTYNADNIELGEGELLLKAPSDADYTSVGGTQGGEFVYTPEYKDIEIGQAFASVKSVLIGEEGTIKVTMVESTLRNLATAMGSDVQDIDTSDPLFEKLVFGGFRKAVYYEAKYVVNKTDNPSKEIRIFLYKVRASSGLTLPFEKDSERSFEVTFTCYASDVNDGALGAIEVDAD